MNNTRIPLGMTGVLLAWLGGSTLLVDTAKAHCDTVRGPVIVTAQAALEKGDVIPVLKWVKREHEAEVRAAFQKTLTVRTKGPEAKELADRFFLETLVRLHRAGEGEPYTGIKEEPVEPIVALADQAVESGVAEGLIEKLTAHLGQGIRQRLQKAVEARKRAEQGVGAGREYVGAYVQYVHYVEGLHNAVLGVSPHAAEVAGSQASHEGHQSPKE